MLEKGIGEQRELARLAGVGETTIVRTFAGRGYSVETLEKIGRVLGLSLFEMLVSDEALTTQAPTGSSMSVAC
jgi:hypothetical protein